MKFLRREIFLEAEKEHYADFLLGLNGAQENPCLQYFNEQLSLPLGPGIYSLTYKAKAEIY